MDKLPITPSPHRFLLRKNKNKTEPFQRQPSGSLGVPGPSASDASQSKTSTALSPSLETNTVNSTIIDPSTRAPKIQDVESAGCGGRADGCMHSGTGTNAGTDAEGTEGRANGVRALNAICTPVGGSASMWKEEGKSSIGEALQMPTAQQMQTPTLSQFKAAPKFRFASSRAGSQKSSPKGVELGINARPHSTQPRWRATQTPLRQSVRREPTEEEIIDVDEEEMLMEDVRESIERQDLDMDVEAGEYGDITYSQLEFETPAPKRRRVNVDPVESFPHTQTLHEHAITYSPLHEDPHSVFHEDGVRGDVDGHDEHDGNDEAMLYDDNDDEKEAPRSLQDDGHHMLPINSQPATPAPTYSQRPRFILPSSSKAPGHTTPQGQSLGPSQHTFAPTPHFVINTPAPTHTVFDENEPQFIKPPKFMHVEEPEPAEPLPAEFSPRKRGQKFVVGGLANEVRSWLVDLETQHQHQHQHQGSGAKTGKDEEGWMVKMMVEDVNAAKGVGWTVAKGRMGDGNALNMILGGEGMMEGLEKGKEAVRGAVVGIKAPVWEVEIGDVRWGVGANWKTWER